MVETDKSYLLFDYWEGKIPDMVYGKTLYVFSSHGHHDHYSPSIYKLENCCRQVHYILSSDIRQVDRSWNKMDHVYFMNVGLPFKRSSSREFILNFGGKPVSTYRWFRFTFDWLNRLLTWCFQE